MDDNSQFTIPNQAPEQEQGRPSATETSGFQSADIIAMGDMLSDAPYDRDGYLDGLAEQNHTNSTHSTSFKQMVGEASRRLTEMERQDYWNENIDWHTEVGVANQLEDSLDQWRTSVSGQTGDDN